MKATFLDGLAAFGIAMFAAKRSFATRPAESATTIRRLAKVMLSVDEILETPELASACQSILDSEEAELPMLVTALAGTIRNLCATLPAERAIVLIVDDEPVISHILSVRLKTPTREILVASNAAQALEIIQHRVISIVILDLGLPDLDGRDVLAEIRLSGMGASLPTLVLSAHEDPRVKTECFALGADEYFEKPVDIDLLTTAVSAKLQRVAEIGRRLRHDPLTGALNRLSFTEMFVRNSAFMARTKGDLSIAILDLDRFKSVNDTYGHAMGDEVLQRVTSVLESALRTSDIFGRWGGEEFVVLFPGTDCAGAVKALEGVALALKEVTFHPEEKQAFKVTFSAGLTEVAPGSTVESAVAASDTLLYRAKSLGRNRIVSSLEPDG